MDGGFYMGAKKSTIRKKTKKSRKTKKTSKKSNFERKKSTKQIATKQKVTKFSEKKVIEVVKAPNEKTTSETILIAQEPVENIQEQSGYSYNYDSYMEEDNEAPVENVDESEMSLYTFCEECKENIFIKYPKTMVTEAKSYPVYFIWIHGKPLHGLLTRIDSHFVSRGERVVEIGFNISDLQNQ